MVNWWGCKRRLKWSEEKEERARWFLSHLVRLSPSLVDTRSLARNRVVYMLQTTHAHNLFLSLSLSPFLEPLIGGLRSREANKRALTDSQNGLMRLGNSRLLHRSHYESDVQWRANVCRSISIIISPSLDNTHIGYVYWTFIEKLQSSQIFRVN